MKNLLEKILAHEVLTFEDARELIYGIESEQSSPEIVAGILIGIEMRGIQLQELAGFRSALLELCHQLELESENAIDLCGTGGDGKNTFNISTTTALTLAAMGVKVIKHGNYGVSSSCGSSNVLQQLGFEFKTNSIALQGDLNTLNICFLHAPLFHPTMKKIASIRSNLGVRTIFNSLGPLVNPVQPSYQLTGTYSLDLARMYQHLLKDNRTNFAVVHGLDGYDELTLTDSTRVLGKFGDIILDSSDFKLKTISPIALSAGQTIEESADLIIHILSGKGSDSQHQVVASNVASALKLYNPESDLQDLFAHALEFIQSGQGAKHFKFN